MKVLVVNGHLPHDSMGGAEYQSWLLAAGLHSRGHEVTFLAADCQEESTDTQEGVGVRRISGRGYVGEARHRQLVADALNKGYDLVYLRDYAELASVVPVSQGYRLPLVFGASSMMDCTPLMPSRDLTSMIWHWRCFRELGHVETIVCQTSDQLLAFKRQLDARYLVIPNGHPIPDEGGGVALRPPVVIWVGNIKRWKRPELFVALAESMTDLDVRFVMIGRPSGGRYGHRIAQLVKKSCGQLRYLGELPVQEVNRLIAQASLLVNTSRLKEGFPNTFIQGWMRGVPTVSLDFDPDGIVVSKELGRRSLSFSRMCLDVRELLANEDQRLEMGRRAREYALTHHTVDRMVDQYEKLFREITEKGSTASHAF